MLEKLNRSILMRWLRSSKEGYFNNKTDKQEILLYRKVLKKAAKDQHDLSVRAKQLQG